MLGTFFFFFNFFFFFKQKTAYEISACLVGSEMCIRDRENARTISAPIIQESFVTLECTLKSMEDLSGAGITAMVVGQVQHAWVDADQSPESRCGKDGYMMLMPGAQNLKTGAPNPSIIASLAIEKRD